MENLWWGLGPLISGSWGKGLAGAGLRAGAADPHTVPQKLSEPGPASLLWTWSFLREYPPGSGQADERRMCLPPGPRAPGQSTQPLSVFFLEGVEDGMFRSSFSESK